LGVGQRSPALSNQPLTHNPQLVRGPWARRLAGHLALARISNSPTVVSNVLAGAALAGGLQLGPALIVAIITMVCLYTAGMYLNDVFDYAADCARRPERPLPSGVVSRTEAARVGFCLLVIGITLLLPLGLSALAAGLLLAVLIVAYDRGHKTNPMSPLVMAACRMMVYVTAFLAFSRDGQAVSALVPLLIVCTLLLGGYLVGLTYVSKVEDKLSHADDRFSRSAGARRLASRYWPAFLVLLPAVFFGPQAPEWPLELIVAVFVAWAAYALWLVYRPVDRDIGGAIGRLIAGISLVDGMVLASTGAGIGVPVALIAFASTHALQRYVKGT
jgi:4-hydroxybenzoate polyprenyltransferase